MSWRVSPWMYPVWDSLCFLDLINSFLCNTREVFNYNLFKYFLRPLLFSFCFWEPYNSNVGAFSVVPRVAETVLCSFLSFFFLLPRRIFWTISSSRPLNSSSAPVAVLVIHAREYLFSFILFFIMVCLFFSSCLLLWKVSFLVFSLSYFQDFESSFLSLFWILFRVDCLFPLHLLGLVRLDLAASSAVCFSVSSFCLNYWAWGLLFTGCMPVGIAVFGVCP